MSADGADEPALLVPAEERNFVVAGSAFRR